MPLQYRHPSANRMPIFIVLLSIVMSIAFIEIDGWPRYQRIIASTELATESTPPAFDLDSPTGYELGMRRLILPQNGLDGFQWITHTQQMLADGGWRIRYTDSDNAMDGREIHWSHGFIWWLVACGKLHSTMTGFPLAASVEAVAPIANTVLLVICIAAIPWSVLRRYGAISAGALAIGLSSNYGMFEYFMIGNPDHHGIAAISVLVSSLMLALGGAGWVSNEEKELGKPQNPRIQSDVEYKITSSSAKTYFIGSALAGSVALWISAATAVPTLIGIGLGAVLSVLLYASPKSSNEIRYLPDLWFWWGFTGFCGSTFFYVLEYFPANMGMRLEVNHPLYGFAWLGGGILLSQLASWKTKGGSPWQSNLVRTWSIASIVAVVLVPLLIAIDSKRFFWIADGFLWSLHKDYISEFESIIRWALQRPSWLPLIRVSLCPILCSVLVLRLFWKRATASSWNSMMGLLLAPAILVTLLGCLQVRWLGIANALWLPLVPTAIACLRANNFAKRFTLVERGIGASIFLAVLFFSPVVGLWESFKERGQPIAIGIDEGTAIYVRDLAHSVRRANPDQETVVLSGPMSTNYMMYYGGAKGIGTLYWENLHGLKSAARIYAAPTELDALELIQRHHISHIAIFAFDAFALEYTRLIRDLPRSSQPQDAFIPALLANPTNVQWLTPLPIKSPDRQISEWALLMEVRPMQTASQAHYGAAQFFESRAQHGQAVAELQLAVSIDAEYRDAWFLLGTLLLAQKNNLHAQEALEKGLDKRSAMEASELCLQAAMKCFHASKHSEAVHLLRRSLAEVPDQPSATNLLAWLLATSFDDSVREPAEALRLAQGNKLLQDPVSYMDTLAAAQAANGGFNEAILTMQQAIKELELPSNFRNNNDRELNELLKHLHFYELRQPFRSEAPR